MWRFINLSGPMYPRAAVCALVLGLLGIEAPVSAQDTALKPCRLEGIQAPASFVESAVGTFRLCLPVGYTSEVYAGEEIWRWSDTASRRQMPVLRVRASTATESQTSALEQILGIGIGESSDSACVDCYRIESPRHTLDAFAGDTVHIDEAVISGGFEHYCKVAMWGVAWTRASDASQPLATYLVAMIPSKADSSWVRSVLASLRWRSGRAP